MEDRTTSGSGSAELPAQRPGDERWQSLHDLGQRCGERWSAELAYASGEVQFVCRVEQAVLLLAFLSDHLEGSNSEALTRGRQLCQWSSNNPQLWSSNFPHPSTPRSKRWKRKFARFQQ